VLPTHEKLIKQILKKKISLWSCNPGIKSDNKSYKADGNLVFFFAAITHLRNFAETH
jgi:hypothetical protein